MGEFTSCRQILIHIRCFSVLPSHLSWAIKLHPVNITHLWVSQNAGNIYRDSLFRDVTWCKLVAGYCCCRRLLNPWRWGPISHPEILVTSYWPIPCGIPDDQKPRLQCGKAWIITGNICLIQWLTASHILWRVTGIWECLWCDAVAKQKWSVKGTMVTSARPPMTSIKFTQLRGNNLKNSAQATLKKNPVWHSRRCSFALGNKYDTNLPYSIFVKILSASDLICQALSFTTT